MLWVTFTFFTRIVESPSTILRIHMVTMTIEDMGDLYLRCRLLSRSPDVERDNCSRLELFVLSLEIPRSLRLRDLDSRDLPLSCPRRSPTLSLDSVREQLP